MNNSENKPEIEIRECTILEEFLECVRLQKEVFGLPDYEISPVRHLVVTKSAGGFILGAFAESKLVGFVLNVPAIYNAKPAFYSHMTAVDKNFQNAGIGAKLKWAQREKALERNINLIKWTFQPILARNAHFNLNRLGAEIREYKENFYGTDYPNNQRTIGLDSDRLYCEWHLQSEKVEALAAGEYYEEKVKAVKIIEIPNDWNTLEKENLPQAKVELTRVRREFQKAFAEDLVVKSFWKDETSPNYLLYKN